MTVELDDLEELTQEIRKLIEGNKAFLDRVVDEDFDDLDEEEPSDAEAEEEFEEL